jgi:NAD(P)-dependent dehydrogenase (short-subunit alcohol dehydrogenase family)
MAMAANIEGLFSLEGKVALVTGASSGIGLHFARLFAAAGARVALAARRMDKLDAAVREIEAGGGRAMAVFMDVTDKDSIAPAFQAAESELGGVVEILVNNSGAIYITGFLEQEEAKMRHIFETNLQGAFLVAQEAARRMSVAKRGAIINIASTSGLRASGLLASYGASKAGLIHLTRIMALELASKGIRVNALCPGNIETEMHDTFHATGLDERVLKRIPQRRFGQPSDLDGAILLLASEAGRYMTGAVVTVDGGQSLSWM